MAHKKEQHEEKKAHSKDPHGKGAKMAPPAKAASSAHHKAKKK